LENAIKKLHEFILKKHGEVIKTWAGLEDNLKQVKDFIMEKIFPKKMTGLERIELEGEVEEEELKEEIKVEEEVFREFASEEEKSEKT